MCTCPGRERGLAFSRAEQERDALKRELAGANLREAMLRDYIAGLEARLTITITTSNTTEA